MVRPERSGSNKSGTTDDTKPSVNSKRAAEAAVKTLREGRASRMASALSIANRKTGLFKK